MRLCVATDDDIRVLRGKYRDVGLGARENEWLDRVFRAQYRQTLHATIPGSGVN